MSSEFDCDVLLVGAGPVGVTLGLLLADEGLSVIAADAADDIYPLPRAAHIDHEVVRVFQSIGAADEIMATSRVAARYDFLTASGEVLLRFDTTGRKSSTGWPPSNMIHQPSLERVLRNRLAQQPAAALHNGWRLTALEQDAGGTTACFAAPDGEKTVRARFLVGCDGARSTVRDLASIDLDDLQFDEPWLVIDTIVEDASRLPDLNLQICDPKRPTTCVQMGAGRHRWEFMMLPGETAEQVSEPAFIAELLRPWKVEGAVRFERAAVYRFHALVARQWRVGRVLLAGDAAHQTPPFAGQGLCAGVRDAANLAWKLAAVIRGKTNPALLDSYQAEREPHVRSFIDLALMMGRTVCITDPSAAAARDAAMIAARAADGGPAPAMEAPPLVAGVLMPGAPGAGTYFPQPWSDDGARLDMVAGSGAWLITRATGRPCPHIHNVALDSPAMRPFSADITAWLDRRGAEAVLVRPDRYVFGAGDPGALAADWAKVLGEADA